MTEEDFAEKLNQLIYDIDPYDYLDNYGSLEDGLSDIRGVLHDADTMQAILSFIYKVMDESPDSLTTEQERRTIRFLVKFVATI